MSVTEAVDPPEHYPLKQWAAKGSEWWVDPDLRADYAAVIVTADLYAKSAERVLITKLDEDRSSTRGVVSGGFSTTTEQRLPFDAWAHAHRLRAARSALRFREYQLEERRRYERTCPSCGQVVNTSPAFGGVKTWLRIPQSVASDQPGTVDVCRQCEPLVRHALAADVLPDGRTREQAAADFVNAWTGRTAPIEVTAAS